MTERWLPIPGYEGRYDVSDMGRVYSHPVPKYRRTGRILKPQIAKDGGYPSVRLGRNGEIRSWTIHTLVLLAFVSPRPKGMDVRHLDGNPQNNLLGNLRYGTRSENVADSIQHGTHPTASKTSCKAGHLFNEENTRIRTDGRSRDCRACQRERQALSRPLRQERTCCRNGHAFTPENTIDLTSRPGKGRRGCRQCQRDKTRRYEQRQRNIRAQWPEDGAA